MATDREALLLQMSMDLRTIQKSIDRANGINDAGFDRMERRATLGARHIEAALGGIRLPSRLSKEFNRLGEDIGRGFQTTSRVAQIALAGISAYAIKLASDAAEIDSAFDVAFKGASASAREFSDVLSKKVGRDAVETREAMTRLQLVLTGTGVAAGQATQIVQTLTEAGIDAGSLFNTSDAEAFQKIISGISGEAEPLKAFGVVINETAVKAELLRLGFKGNATEASEAAKSIARANLIVKGLAVAQGDATRTAGSAANQTRALRAEFNAAARDLGQQLLPQYVRLTKFSAGVLKGFNDLPDGIQIASIGILAFIAASGPIAGLLANLGRVIQLAKETRAAIIAIGTANAAAGAGTGAGAVAAGAGRVGAGAAAGLAGGLAAAGGTAVFGVAEIVQGAKYQKTVKAVTEATDAAIAGSLESAKAQIRAAASGGPAGKAAVTRLTRDAAILSAEQARRAATASVQAPAAAGGATSPTTVQGGFGLSPDQLQAAGGGKGAKAAADKAGRAAARQAEQALRQQERTDGLIARANLDLVAARGDQAQTAEQRYQAELEAIDTERATRANELAYAVKQGDLTKAQAEQVSLVEESARIQRRITAENEKSLAQAEAARSLRAAELDGEINFLILQGTLSHSESERQAISLRLVDLAYQIEKAQLDSIIANTEIADADREIARAKLRQLNAQQPGLREEAQRSGSEPVRQANSIIGDVTKQSNLGEDTAAMYAEVERQRQADLISEERAAQAKAEIDARYTEQRLANAQSFFGNLATLTQSGNKTLHAIGKAAAIAQATIDGILAVQKALASAPPPLNFVLAAAAGVAAAVNVAKIAGLAEGGPVVGPGGPRDDKVPIWASNGEFVVNAQATQRNMQLLQMINSGRTPAFANGGPVGVAARPQAFRLPEIRAAPRAPAPLVVQPMHFDMRGAVTTPELLADINGKIARSHAQARALAVQDVNAQRYLEDLNS